jgi:hypothetical protein
MQGGCEGCEGTDVLVLRIDSTNINVLRYSRGTVRFEPLEGTSFSGSGSGSWEDGAITYGVADDGAFEIVMDGVWMQAEAMANRDRFPNTFTIEIPMTHADDRGTFNLLAFYEYNDEADGTGWRRIAEDSRELRLPYKGTPKGIVGLILQCVDVQGEACVIPVTRDPDE